jgi:hypothetical protein
LGGKKLEKGGIELYDFVVCVYPSLSYTDESIFFLSWCHGKSFSPYYFFVHRRDELSVRQIICLRFISNLHFIWYTLYFFRAALSPITLPNTKILYSTNNNVPSSFVCLCVCLNVGVWFSLLQFLNNCEMIINTGKKRWQSFFNEITSCTWLVIISLVYSQLFFSWSEWLYSTRIDYLDRDDSDWPLHHVSI